MYQSVKIFLLCFCLISTSWFECYAEDASLENVQIQKNGPYSQLKGVYLDPATEELQYIAKDNTFAKASLWTDTLQIENGNSPLPPFADTQIWDGTTLILADCNTSFMTHYFHFLEHLLGIWEFGGCEKRESIKQIVFCASDTSQDFGWQGVNAINYKIIKALFPNASVHTLGGLKKKAVKPIFMPSVLFSSRLQAFKEPEHMRLNKMLGPNWQEISSEKIEKLKSIILSSYQIPVQEAPSQYLRVTYLKRSPPRCLIPRIENRLLYSIQLMRTQLKIVDLAAIPYEEQLKVIANTDVLISVHGNGLSHIPFLPKGATVIEFFSPDSFTWDYCMLARIKGADYWGTNASNWWVTSETPFSFSPFGNVSTPITECDFGAILEILAKKSASLDAPSPEFGRAIAQKRFKN